MKFFIVWLEPEKIVGNYDRSIIRDYQDTSPVISRYVPGIIKIRVRGYQDTNPVSKASEGYFKPLYEFIRNNMLHHSEQYASQKLVYNLMNHAYHT